MGSEEEREQNVTIDTAQTYFKTARRKYVIIDAPGHKEFLRTCSPARPRPMPRCSWSTPPRCAGADPAPRHVLSLLGIQQVIVAINKLDLVDWSERVYDKVKDDATKFLHGLGITPSSPCRSRPGKGTTLRACRTAHRTMTARPSSRPLDSFNDIRSPTISRSVSRQDVYRWDDDRYYAGRVEAGGGEGRRRDRAPAVGPPREDPLHRGLGPRRPPERRGRRSGGVDLRPGAVRGARRSGQPRDATDPSRHRSRRQRVLAGAAAAAERQKLIFKLATAETEATVVQIDERIDSSTLQMIERHADRIENTEAGTVTFSPAPAAGVGSLRGQRPRLESVRGYVVGGIVRGGGTVHEVRADAADGQVRGPAGRPVGRRAGRHVH
ncbi:MAG: GTP-binding protein, partial [Gammaproteobacteria bacterium]|nr:GTP-binding protein [Gammaproteobacteria bacterium]